MLPRKFAGGDECDVPPVRDVDDLADVLLDAAIEATGELADALAERDELAVANARKNLARSIDAARAATRLAAAGRQG